MKRCLTCSLAVLGLAFHLSALSAIVYDGGAPNQFTGYWAGTNWDYPTAATKATFAAPVTFSGMNWWGVIAPWNGRNGAASGDAFTLSILEGSGSTPGAVLHTISLGSGAASATGNLVAFALPEFSYSSTFVPVTLGAGAYYFALSNAYNANDGSVWGWETTQTGSGGASYLTSVGWQEDVDENLAFNLTGPEQGRVPVPPTALLFATGLAAAARLRRRTHPEASDSDDLHAAPCSRALRSQFPVQEPR